MNIDYQHQRLVSHRVPQIQPIYRISTNELERVFRWELTSKDTTAGDPFEIPNAELFSTVEFESSGLDGLAPQEFGLSRSGWLGVVLLSVPDSESSFLLTSSFALDGSYVDALSVISLFDYVRSRGCLTTVPEPVDTRMALDLKDHFELTISEALRAWKEEQLNPLFEIEEQCRHSIREHECKLKGLRKRLSGVDAISGSAYEDCGARSRDKSEQVRSRESLLGAEELLSSTHARILEIEQMTELNSVCRSLYKLRWRLA